MVPIVINKLSKSIVGQLRSGARWIQWASSNRTNSQLVWVHSASVGESLTAVPVVHRLRKEFSNLQILHSYTSPSTAVWGSVFDSERSDYLPLGTSSRVREIFNIVRPNLVVYSRGDIWPATALSAASLQIPQAIISGTVNPSSKRLQPIARVLMQKVYRHIDWVGAISNENAKRWVRLGVSQSVVSVTGDTRHDQVLERKTKSDEIETLENWALGRDVLVAGSTDLVDEQMILKVFKELHRSGPSAGLVLVPHEVSDARVRQIVALARNIGQEPHIWDGQSIDRDTACVIVNRLGILADAYSFGTVAYVGGGFKRGGLHTVLEPAALSKPVIVGPEWKTSEEARNLIESDGCVSLSNSSPDLILRSTWNDWNNDPETRETVGKKARASLHEGASDVTAEVLSRLISDNQRP